MSDKEPRRRKKRKDSAKKDDMRSDDHIFMPTRTESKDSDLENEEETPLPIHQPSAFAKIVFVILFSGLIVSMSFIFISLHGADRGSVDLFDDHHSDEHISIESIEQIENASLTSSEEPEHSSEEDHAHEEVEPWSSSEFLPENLLNMLPNIGNILSFNNEKEDTPDTSLSEEADFDELQKSTETNQERLKVAESDTKSHDEPPEDISTQQHFEDRTENKDTTQDINEEIIQPPIEVKSDIKLSSFEEDLSQLTEEQYSQDFSSSSSTPDVTSQPVAEQEQCSEETVFSSNEESLEETLSNQIPQDFDTTPDYDEEDKLSYEKAFITSEDDYGFREELDELDALLGKNLPDEDNSNGIDESDIDEDDDSDEINDQIDEEADNGVEEEDNGDDDDDDDDDDEEEEDDEPRDEFDFWQF